MTRSAPSSGVANGHALSGTEASSPRVQADQGAGWIKNVKGNTLDPSPRDPIMSTKMIIDATAPGTESL